MIKILIDRSMEGPASILWGMLCVEGWVTFFPLKLKALVEVGLPETASDQEVWRFAQNHQMILLTGSRSLESGDVLENLIRQEHTSSAWPVLTITQLNLITTDRNYQELCLDRLLEILENINSYKGKGRIFLP